ncbi:hypothetical protein KY320_03090 [Candidatus Woesearchaeota archaeon]|nr:hypothetical protein [Candidatus Woesearchaeota archaeon]
MATTILGYRLSERQALLAKLCGAVAAGALLVGGGQYLANLNSDMASNQRHTLVERVDTIAFKKNPGVYIDTLTQQIISAPSELEEYSNNIGSLLTATNESELLDQEDRVYLMISNAALLPSEKGIGVCEDYVIGNAEQQQQVDHLVRGINTAPVKSYARVFGTMIARMGKDAYGFFENLIKR